MKICLYSSQLQALTIIDVPADMPPNRRVAIRAIEPSPSRVPDNLPPVSTTYLQAIAKVEPLHYGSDLHTMMAKSIDEKNDQIIAELLAKSLQLYACV